MTGDSQRVHTVDVLRGFAMLGVIAVHARAAVDWPWHGYVVNRAAPVFLMLMGVSAEFFRQRHARAGRAGLAKAYLGATARRLLVPFWSWLAVLAVVALVAGTGPRSSAEWLLSPFGYVAWAGPTWLLTVIALISLAVPVLHFMIARLGPAVVGALGLAVTVLCHLNALAVIDALRPVLPLRPEMPGFFLFWVFAPSYVWHVVAGMWLGRRRAHVTPDLFSVAVLALIWGYWGIAQLAASRPFLANGLRGALDVPLTIVLLGLVQLLARSNVLGMPLAFVGRASWGVYLGHSLVLATLQFHGHRLQFGDLETRLVYFAGLSLAGLLLTILGRTLRSLAARRVPILGRTTLAPPKNS
ncbi:MAG: acyltransferase [Myxococcales bacterium]|nr:acyltransferase [Myxococcales bacterium]